MDGLSGKADFRRVTQAAVMGAEVLDANRAWSVYDEIHSDSRVGFVWEPAGLESEWPRLAHELHRQLPACVCYPKAMLL